MKANERKRVVLLAQGDGDERVSVQYVCIFLRDMCCFFFRVCTRAMDVRGIL